MRSLRPPTGRLPLRAAGSRRTHGTTLAPGVLPLGHTSSPKHPRLSEALTFKCYQSPGGRVEAAARSTNPEVRPAGGLESIREAGRPTSRRGQLTLAAPVPDAQHMPAFRTLGTALMRLPR